MKAKHWGILSIFLLVTIHIFLFSACGTAAPHRQEARPAGAETSRSSPAPTPGETLKRESGPSPTPAPEYRNKIIISELCAKNSAGIRDTFGAFSDWIEIANLSAESLTLKNLSITNDETDKKKYRIPECVLEPGKSLLIFASGKNQAANAEFHAPFKLSAEGETISLYTENGDLLDRVTYRHLEENRSLYKNAPGCDMEETCYMTPGFPNTDAGYEAYCRSQKAAGPILISELAVTNDTLLKQSDGKCYDWVEIQNISSQPVDIGKYSITDKIDQMKYSFPDLVIEPGGFFVLICSGAEKIDPSGYRHAGFSLNAASESLYLYENKTHTLIDWVHVEKAPYGASYGRKEGQGGFYYFTRPTPGAKNAEGRRKVCEEAKSSIPEGVYGEGTLKIAFQAAGTIYYTTDGSEPDQKSKKYTTPLTVTKSTVIRTIVFQSGQLPSKIKTYSYFIDPDTTLPVLSLVTENDNLWSAETGIYVKGNHENYYQDWERAASLALFENGKGFSMDCGLKMNGSGSRESDEKKSFKVKFRGKYGKKQLEYDLFGNGVTTFDSLVLRAGEDYRSSIFRNELFTTFARKYVPSLLTQAGKYCSLYINGEYFGIYYLQERFDEKYYAEHFDVPEESVSVSEYLPDPNSDLYDVMQFAKRNDMTKAENYRYIRSRIDLESMTDWFILEAYSGNTDAIQNIRYMKSDADGGKWKWAFYDLDWAFYFHKNAFQDLIAANLRETNAIIRPLLKNNEYKHYFLERLAYHIDTTFQEEKILSIIDAYETLLKPEIEKERALWGGSRSGWEQSVAQLRSFVTESDRSAELIESITEVLHLTGDEVRQYFQ